MTAKAQSLLVQAQKTLLTPYGLDVADLTQVFGKIMTHQVDYADLYFQYSRSEAWSLEEGIVKAGSFSIDEGVGVRALSGEKTAFAYSDDISAQALGDAAGAVRAIAAAGQERGVPALKRRSGHQLYVPHDPLASLDAASKVKTARTAGGHGARRRSARHAGHGAPRRRIRGRPGCRQRRSAGCRHPAAGARVDDRHRRGRRASANRARRAAADAPITVFSPTPCCTAMRARRCIRR